MGWVVGLVYYLVYGIAALALWRLWGTNYKLLWFLILGAVILKAWTAATSKTAYNQERKLLLVNCPSPTDAQLQIVHQAASECSVVNFWVKVNIVVSILTALLSGIGLALSFR
jgi:hypothetical protein